MPAKARWLLRIPEILGTLRAHPTLWLDRDAIEQVFRLRRRRAIELLHAFGGFQAGKTFLVERDAVIRHLEGLLAGEKFQWEKRRRERLSVTLAEAERYAQAANVNIVPPPDSPALPEGVCLEAGRLVVEFRDVEDLLAKFYAVAQTAAGDFAAFQKSVETAQSPRARDILPLK